MHACQRLIRTLPLFAILRLALEPAMLAAAAAAMPPAVAQDGAGGRNGGRRGAEQQDKYRRREQFQYGSLHRCFISCGADRCPAQRLCLHADEGGDVHGAHSCVQFAD